MKTAIAFVLVFVAGLFAPALETVYQFDVKTIDGEKISLSKYEGKVMLIVNTASKCGYTPQYEGLQGLYEKYEEKGFVILGFPANNFMGQEPGTDSQIQTFCEKNYGVTFPMMSKISVKGSDKAALYEYLTNKEANGKVGGEIKWNFQKYLINRKGEVVEKFNPGTKPMDEELISAIEAEL
ncbi:glutathione peroxidase [Salibacter sp.]|uniref:glutathione peroxidase n=1 Tax=Salibacter sp. TaxID=2010995 RepID=UPI0028706F54|nr:glutathione peroxidase [Salibacter sp.]MDR9399598.1 glutathione peroxidase [Salibacter sp.]MDR9486845.1 glutathione peroxidase [Salibacter sp.]